MNTFFLKVIASDKVFFSGKAEMVNIPTLDGEKVFLAHHENIVIAIEMGDLKFRTEDGETHHAVVGKGFAQVINNRVTVLVDSAERPEDIDKNQGRGSVRACQRADAPEAEYSGILSFPGFNGKSDDTSETLQPVFKVIRIKERLYSVCIRTGYCIDVLFLFLFYKNTL